MYYKATKQDGKMLMSRQINRSMEQNRASRNICTYVNRQLETPQWNNQTSISKKLNFDLHITPSTKKKTKPQNGSEI